MTTVMLFDPNDLDTPGNRCTRDWVDTPEHRAVLDWCRSEGLHPENTARLEIVKTIRGFKAKLKVYDLDDEGHKLLSRGGEHAATHSESKAISCLPPLT
ncbi:hypothetical protein ACIBHX_01965 [Nonomuraea sp. NPDC050536]|uniref:hypothetical protein n=1 Tax=Nonomuraea sp. NPDC050536 TaxID=3364366 RepID=UPI0037C5A52F